MENSGRLFSFVNKQIRKKHLIEGIRHTQIRELSRSQKLKNHYETPLSTPNSIFLYSNIFEEVMMICQFDSKPQVYSLLKNMLSSLNNICYKLWCEQKQSKRNLFFQQNRNIIYYSFLFLIVIFLFVSLLFPFFINFASLALDEASKKIILKMIVLLLSAQAIICLVCLFFSLNSSYNKFDYDRKLTKMLATQLKHYQKRLNQLDLSIRCDRELTWIQITQKQHRVNILKQTNVDPGLNFMCPKLQYILQ